jgi:CheY-like chemotaxis protein
MQYSVSCMYMQQPHTRAWVTRLRVPNRVHEKEMSLPTPYENLLRRLCPVTSPKPVVLCIEDDPIYLTLRKKVLEREGYDVIGVTMPVDALNTVREAPVCAVVADHMLQGTTGTELAKELKKIKADVPIILFSGTLPRRLDGVDVYINKGEPTSEFLRILREVVQRFNS